MLAVAPSSLTSPSSYYQSDESRGEATINDRRVYAGGASQWKASYRTVAAAVRSHAPKVKLCVAALVFALTAQRLGSRPRLGRDG